MNGEKFISSTPCQRVNTTGRKSLGSWLNRIVAPDLTCRSTLLSRWMAPVRNVPPDGTITCPPPARLHALIAAANAAVFLVTPSPTAPKSVIGKCRGRNRGRRIEATIRSAAASAGMRLDCGVVEASAVADRAAVAVKVALAPASAPRRRTVRLSRWSDIGILPLTRSSGLDCAIGTGGAGGGGRGWGWGGGWGVLVGWAPGLGCGPGGPGRRSHSLRLPG